MYLPKNLITTDLYTNGDQFVDNDGNSYKGYYFSTKFGTYYKGKNPNDISFGVDFRQKEIYPTQLTSQDNPSPYPVNTIINITDFDSKRNAKKPIQGGFGQEGYAASGELYGTNPSYLSEGMDDAATYLGNGYGNGSTEYSPITVENFPTLKDYENGYFTRYFCVKVNEDLYYEIYKQTYDDIFSKNPEWDNNLYIPFKVLWYLKGDMIKTETINRELVQLAEQNLQRNGFSTFLKEEYLKYFRISPGINLFNNSGLRTYPDSKPISLKLPKAYQLGNSTTERINLNVPAKQNCGNCIFNKTHFCSKWKAEIRHNYWCAAYKGKYGKGKLLNMTSQPMDSTESQPTPPSTYTPTTTTTSTPPITPTPTPSPSTGGGSIGGGGYSGGGGGY
jgi:hypothetical protein